METGPSEGASEGTVVGASLGATIGAPDGFTVSNGAGIGVLAPGSEDAEGLVEGWADAEGLAEGLAKAPAPACNTLERVAASQPATATPIPKMALVVQRCMLFLVIETPFTKPARA
jgi:hypothetical protein